MIICPARVGGHQNSGVITDIAWLASQYNVRFLITGIYYGNLAEAIAAAQRRENIFFETHLLNSPDGFEVMVEQVGSKRLLYGSLLPLINASIQQDERDDILYGNIQRELGWNNAHR